MSQIENLNNTPLIQELFYFSILATLLGILAESPLNSANQRWTLATQSIPQLYHGDFSRSCNSGVFSSNSLASAARGGSNWMETVSTAAERSNRANFPRASLNSSLWFFQMDLTRYWKYIVASIFLQSPAVLSCRP